MSLGNIDESTISANDYVKDKLEEQGMDTSGLVVTREGKILTDIEGLSEVALAFIKESVPVGATVTGYDLSSNTVTSYTTSGKENTAPEGTETAATTQNVSRANTLTWKYLGMDENGKVLIALDVTSSTSTMTISGGGGYLNGPKELNTVCEALYSSDMGTARSMNYEDVTRLLEYTGPVGQYYNASGTIKYLTENKTIGELLDNGEISCSPVGPNNSNLSNLYVDYTEISKTSPYIESGDIVKNLVYQGIYWLASSTIHCYSYIGASCDVRFVSSNAISSCQLYYLEEGAPSYGETLAIRPIVELSSDIQVSYDGTTATLSK